LGKIDLGLPVNLEIHDLFIKNASLDGQIEPEMQVKARGVDIHLSASLNDAISAKGELSMDTLFAPYPYYITDFSTTLLLHPGKIEVSDCSFMIYKGKCNLSASIDTSADTLLNAKFSLTNMHLAPLLKTVQFNRGKVDGTISCEMSINGHTLDPKEWRGRGNFNAAKIELSELPFQNTLAKILFLPDLLVGEGP
jgi:hypothetical protein